MKYKTREEKLRNAIEDELSRKKPSVDNIVEVVKNYENVNLKTIDKLQRKKKAYTKRINGALKQSINSHGPITRNLMGSATKRIYGSLIELEKENNRKINIKSFIVGVISTLVIGGLILVIF